MPVAKVVAVLNQNDNEAYTNENIIKIMPVVMLVKSGGLSLLKTAGTKAIIKNNEPPVKIKSLQSI